MSNLNSKLISIIVTLTTLFSGPMHALEMDPYATWKGELRDSSEIINDYINHQIQTVVEDARSSISCENLAIKSFKKLHRLVFIKQPLINFLNDLRSGVDADKGAGIRNGYFSSVFDSIYRYIPQLYLTSVSSVVNVNGVRIGDDKFGHFFGFGRRYYNRYLRYLRRGNSPEVAERRAIRFGIRMENSVVGSLVDGVFSHSDLEANYQGFRMIRNFCEGDNVLFKKIDRHWQMVRQVDIRDYMNVRMDEYYNPNGYVKLYWLVIKPRVMKYCDMLGDQEVLDRLQMYQSMDEESLSQVLIRTVLNTTNRPTQDEQSLTQICKLKH